MDKNFTNLMKTIKAQIHEAQRTSSIRSIKKTTSRHIIIKLLNTNDKEKTLKAATGKNYMLHTEEQR